MPAVVNIPKKKTTGLRYWMLRVLEECERAAVDFSADPVHDLRVALRRCRSMADGLIAMDPDPEWKAMKKAGKRLFQRLGALRDVQIMMEWIEKLGLESESGPAEERGREERGREEPDHPESDVFAPFAGPGNGFSATANEVSQAVAAPPAPDAAKSLLMILRAREVEQKREARAALEEFDRKQWRQWSHSLPQRATRIPLGSPLFKHLALERWTVARDLHSRALRNRSQIAFHTLRIGIKRFRYIVENFLPAEHKAWSNALKEMQDLLGDVHDLDVLWATAQAGHIFVEESADDSARDRWHARIGEERAKRLNVYREKTTGPDSLWLVWRAGLPQGKQIRDIATRRMVHWAKALDPDFAHSERVAHLAVELYDGLAANALLGPESGVGTESHKISHGSSASRDARAVLSIAALLHDVGKSEGDKGHHKASFELIRAHGAPLGWKFEEMQRAAIVARFHRGALPTRSHKTLRDLLPDEQKQVIQLAAILRLANAFDAAHDGHIRKVRIENSAKTSTASGRSINGHSRRANGLPRKPATLGKNEALVIATEGYHADSPVAQTIAAERHLLETVLRRPVVVKAMSNS